MHDDAQAAATAATASVAPYTFGKPQRTAFTVFVPVEGARPRFTFNDISHIHLRSAAHKAGSFTMTAVFPHDSWAAEQLEVFDVAVIAATLQNNTAWFKNALTAEQIEEFFEPTVQKEARGSNTGRAKVHFHVSATNVPKVSYKGAAVELDDFLTRWQKEKAHLNVTAVADVVGILFEKQRFRVRVLLRSIEAVGEAAIAGEVAPDRLEIEEEWHTAIQSTMPKLIRDHELKLRRVQEVDQELRRRLEMARHAGDDASWNAHLEFIDKTLRDIRSGAWNYLT